MSQVYRKNQIKNSLINQENQFTNNREGNKHQPQHHRPSTTLIGGTSYSTFSSAKTTSYSGISRPPSHKSTVK
jgi:hypothetical protein